MPDLVRQQETAFAGKHLQVEIRIDENILPVRGSGRTAEINHGGQVQPDQDRADERLVKQQADAVQFQSFRGTWSRISSRILYL